MKGGTLFSGIGAPEVAAPDIDWRWCAEIEPFPSAVYAHHFPYVPNLGDVTRIDPDAVEPVDLIVFGSPCQDFSVAGNRKGMDGERGNLSLVALALVARLRPRWVVFENVPGLLSNWSGEAPGDLEEGEEREADQYSDIAAFLGMVRECGYLGCWRVYDAQYAGVPQRRRRVFFVGYLGDWRPAAAVLFERESLRGDSPPSREPGKRIAASLTHGVDSRGKGGYAGRRREDDVNLVAKSLGGQPQLKHREDADTLVFRTSSNCGAWETGDRTDALTQATDPFAHLVAFGGNNTSGPIDIATACAAHGGPHGRLDFGSETFVAVPINEVGKGTASKGVGRNGDGLGDAGDPMFTLQRGAQHAVAFESRYVRNGRGPPDDVVAPLKAESGTTGKGDAAPLVAFQASQSGFRETDAHATLDANNSSRRHNGVASGMTVRRLMPVEAERLQGLPDGFTDIIFRGKPAADGPRYRALGSSMAVPCIGWILDRIQLFERGNDGRYPD